MTMNTLKRFAASSLLAVLLVAGAGVADKAAAAASQCKVVGYSIACMPEVLSGGMSCVIIPEYECVYYA
jgi:hypothetical protein